MAKKTRISDLPEFDASRYLDNEEAIAEYLTAILEENDPALLAAALGDIARARGMAEIARESNTTREALYKALRPDAQPRFDAYHLYVLKKIKRGENRARTEGVLTQEQVEARLATVMSKSR